MLLFFVSLNANINRNMVDFIISNNHQHDNDNFLSPDELLSALNEGILESIKSSGNSLPSSALSKSHPVQCEWTEYASVSSSSPEGGEGEKNNSARSCPIINDLRQFFPNYLDGSEYDTRGRPLIYAACLGLLMSCGDNKAAASSAKGDKSPLSTFLSIVSFLMNEVGANPNQPTETPGACHRPPLHLAARSCHPAAVRALIDGGAADARDDEGWTALMACCMADIPSAENGGPLVEDRVETMKILLNEIDDTNYVNAMNWNGHNALHMACTGLNYELIKCLLETGGADATMKTLWGQSCICLIQCASEEKSEEAAKKKCEALIVGHLEKTGQMESIRPFLEEERKIIKLMSLADDILIPASRRPECTAEKPKLRLNGANAQDERVVIALMKYLGMDPTALFQRNDDNLSPVDGNIYAEIYARVMDLIPKALRKVYRDHPTDFEREIVVGTNYNIRDMAIEAVEGVRHVDPSKIMMLSFHVFRERGMVAERMSLFTDLVVGPLQRTFSFAVPGDDTVKEIVSYAPSIVEMGAGTGYWSEMLSRAGADVVAYDMKPSSEQDDNIYVGKQKYFPVQEGVDSTVFVDNNTEIVDRALLMVWPNNPDDVDNPHLRREDEPELPPIWDIDCVQKYYDLGGQTVIYIGEREDKIKVAEDAVASDCGFCGSRKFQQFLLQHFDLVAEIQCPQWWMKEDDVTVWKRKR
jgi:hypothetical protein